MALIVEIGTVSFPAAGTTGNETVNLTKFSSAEPLKAVLFFTTNNVTINTAAAANALFLVGMTDGTTQGCAYSIADDNEPITISSRNFTNAYCLEVNNSSGTTSTGQGAITDFTATSFELTYSGVTSNSTQFYYVAIGGSDITDAAVVFWDEPETDESNPKSVTVGFQPDCIITTGSATPTVPLMIENCRQVFGVCVGPNVDDQRSYVWESYDNVTTTDCRSRMSETGAVGRALSTAYSAVTLAPESNGFSVNVADSSATSTEAVQYCSLCLKGGEYRLLKIQTPTSTGTQDNETNLSSISGVIALAHAGNVEYSTSHNRMSIGFSDGTVKYALGRNEADASADSDTYAWRFDDRFIQVYQITTSLLTADVDFIGGNVQLDWTDVDASARDMFILAMGTEVTGSLFMGMNC
jgi:hypothetical protein